MILSEIKELVSIFEKSELSFLEIKDDNTNIKMKKGQKFVASIPQVSRDIDIPVIESQPVKHQYKTIKAPVVGVFYRAASPENPPFVTVGQKIEKGDVIGLIEAMKMMSEIKATVSGTIRSIDVQNEQLVSFDDILMQVED